MEISTCWPLAPDLRRPAVQESGLRQENDAAMAALAAEEGAEPLKLTSKYATSLSTQRKWLVRKFLGIYWYSPSYSE